jgi:hypothetical protein
LVAQAVDDIDDQDYREGQGRGHQRHRFDGIHQLAEVDEKPDKDIDQNPDEEGKEYALDHLPGGSLVIAFGACGIFTLILGLWGLSLLYARAHFVVF